MAKALHEQAAEYIRKNIQNGTYPVGGQIPTENELTELLGISRPTLRLALERLTQEGLLMRVKGKGTFVRQPKVLHESTRFITGYRAEAEKHHCTMRTRVLELNVQTADAHVAAALGLSEKEKVTRLTRLRHLEGTSNKAPVLYTTVFVPHSLFPDMETLDFTDLSFYDILAQRNMDVRHAVRRLEVMMPPSEVSAALGITPFEPCVFISSTGYTASGAAIEYAESYYPASSSSFLIEVNR